MIGLRFFHQVLCMKIFRAKRCWLVILDIVILCWQMFSSAWVLLKNGVLVYAVSMNFASLPVWNCRIFRLQTILSELF